MTPAAPVGGERPRPALASNLEVSLVRLEEIIDQETSALRSRKSIDLKEYNDRKSQALLDLTRSLRSLPTGEANATLTSRISSLQSKLAINRAVLKMHLEAVREISTTLSDAIREADSDGTYDPSAIARRL
jgi:flagellar biosynthesis/type III secretory pathway chaperone